MSSDEFADEAQHTIEGYIHDHKVTLIVEGPEQQDLPEDTERLGSDNVCWEMQVTLDELKDELEPYDAE